MKQCCYLDVLYVMLVCNVTVTVYMLCVQLQAYRHSRKRHFDMVLGLVALNGRMLKLRMQMYILAFEHPRERIDTCC